MESRPDNSKSLDEVESEKGMNSPRSGGEVQFDEEF